MFKIIVNRILLIVLGVLLPYPAAGAELDADVIVAGGGGSGIAAAVAAAEKGAKVIVLEAKKFPGGTTNFPGGLFAVESRMQKQMAKKSLLKARP